MEDSNGKKILNILLLGETGVGKSTFINAFVNYTIYDSLYTAKSGGLQCLIASKFEITDENYKQITIAIGKDANESTEIGTSATQAAKSYKFVIKNGEECFGVRFIDTPGIGDTRGIEQDERNFENVLNYISQYDELHAICILLKPNNARITAQFEFCLNKLFCQLEKSASKNIIFVFTNTRGTFYRPGDTRPALEKLLDNVAKRPPYVRIPIQKQNVYCYDNESFRFLAALQNNVNFSEEDEANFAGSWVQSSKECWSMLDYIRGTLVPHKVEDTISVNNARNFIFQLSRPLADITQLISDNILLMERRKDELSKDGLTLNELKGKLYIPQTDVRLKELPQPVTVCASPQCVQPYTVNGKTVSHYTQRCHNPCYLSNVPKEIIGSPELLDCWAMAGTQDCTQCSCSYSFHMHIYYETELFENNIVDVNVNQTITTKEGAVEAAKELVKKLTVKIKSYEDEREFIIKSVAKFSHFLVNNAIAPYNDAYKQYFQYLLDREKALGDGCDKDALKNIENLLARYDEERNILKAAVNDRNKSGVTENTVVTAKDITSIADKLYQLPNFGQNIKDAFQMQNRGQGVEFKNDEYKHRTVLSRQKTHGKPVQPRGSSNNRNPQNQGSYNRNAQSGMHQMYPQQQNNVQGPPMGYQGPPMGNQGPPMGYQGPHMGYQGPPMGYQGPPMGNQGPPMGNQGPHGGSYYQGQYPMGYQGPNPPEYSQGNWNGYNYGNQGQDGSRSQGAQEGGQGSESNGLWGFVKKKLWGK